MKKIFTLFTALLVVCVVNAEEKEINPGTNTLHSALYEANAGDVIVLKNGTYVENRDGSTGYITFDKNITVKAKEGAHPIIMSYVPAQIKSGAIVTIKGIKWDATHLQDADHGYEHIIYATDASTGKKLILEDCEFCNHRYHAWEKNAQEEYEDQGETGNSVIYCGSSYKLDNVTITNCYFHDITKSCLFFENADMASLTVKNSTFANIAAGSSSKYYAGNIFLKSSLTSVTVLVDHCTFYDVNCMNTDYGAVKVGGSNAGSKNVTISNCVFMMPSSYSGGRAVYLPENKGEITGFEANVVKYCLTYNYTKDDTGYHGIHSGPTRTAIQSDVNPIFTDAANNNFTLGQASAINVDLGGGESTTLGDPRWWPTKVTPAYAYTTYVAPQDLNFSYAGSSGLTAYVATAAGGGKVTMSPIVTAPKGTPLLLIGTAGTEYSIAGDTLGTKAPATNFLRAGDGTTVFNGTTWDYLLFSDGLFYQIGSGTVATDKAYLHLGSNPNPTPGAPGLPIIFQGNNATDINAIEAQEEAVKFFQNGKLFIQKNGVVYDMMGAVVK